MNRSLILAALAALALGGAGCGQGAAAAGTGVAGDATSGPSDASEIAATAGDSASAQDATPAGDAAPSADSPVSAEVAAADATSAANSISGTAMGQPFSEVGATWYIGKPDTPTDTVVFVFNMPVACDQITKAGWDSKLPKGALSLEMGMKGSKLDTYPVVSTPTPAPGEAFVNISLTKGSGANEVGALSGKLVLEQYVAQTSAKGSFELVLPGGEQLNGTFDAKYCAGGREP